MPLICFTHHPLFVFGSCSCLCYCLQWYTPEQNMQVSKICTIVANILDSTVVGWFVLSGACAG